MNTPTRTLAEITGELSQADLSALPILRLAILRNITLEPLAAYLRHEALALGRNAEVRLGEFDNVFQEALGGAPEVYGPDTDAVLVFLHLETLSPALASGFNALSADDVAQEIQRLREHCSAIVQALRARTPAMILWHGFLPPLHPALGLYDSQTGQGQGQAVARLNAELRDAVREAPNAFFVDLALCQARVGGQRFLDNRYWHLGRAPLTLDACAEIARENAKFLRARLGMAKKCLVLDCDNTLWGGIIGEDGMAGIKLGQSAPGSAFVEFQCQVLELYNRGVILALCSKNNEEDVLEVLDKHPDMVLRRSHFAALRVNWRDKAANLRELAAELNIGLDSMVFADDSEFEINLVGRELPEVGLLHMAKSRLYQLRETLAACGWFDTLTISREDRLRGGMYAAESQRKQLLGAATDMDSYYRSLQMRLTITLADSFTIPRVAQQTQKTNQFNLTTRRYSEADIAGFVARPDADVLCVQLSDRFGDSGIVGSCILCYQEHRALLDTFLLSCRALGRGVEEALLVHALRLARQRGATVAEGLYLPTRKNAQVADFYAKQGFAETAREPDGAARFELSLEGEPGADPDFFAEIISPVEP